MRTKLVKFLTSLFYLDIFSHLRIMVGTAAIIVLFVSFFTFFLYLYQPIFTSFEAVFILNPSIDYELLNKVLDESTKRQQDLTTKLSQQYPDPFQ